MTCSTKPLVILPAGAWEEAPTQLRGLRSLRLALSDVRELALALPLLTTLDVNGCASLATLELRCPALLHGLFQSVGRCDVGPGCHGGSFKGSCFVHLFISCERKVQALECFARWSGVHENARQHMSVANTAFPDVWRRP